MKRFVLFILLFLFKAASSQIPNNSFENWNNGNPDWWVTTNIPIVPASIIPDSDSYAGMLAVRGRVVSDLRNKPFPPYLGIYGSAAQGFPISFPYDQVIGWCKIFLKPGDRFMGDVRMYDSHQEPVGDGKIVIDTSVSKWMSFIIQVNYYGLLEPVSCALYFTITDSSLLNSGQTGSYFILDELSLNSNVGEKITVNDEKVFVFPNPVKSEMHIKNYFSENNFNYSLSDISGKILFRKNKCQEEEIINTCNFAPGIYFLSCISEEMSFVKKVVIE